MAFEKPSFTVESEFEDGIELRRYPAYVLVETEVDASFEEAGNQAFRRLAGYIGGNNQTVEKVSMTVPVAQRATHGSEKISMTVPVAQREQGGRYVISFFVPSKYNLESAPKPTDSRVWLREVPAGLVASIKYRGRWTESRYQEHLQQLQAHVASQGWQITGEPTFARYNPPIVPSFLRRNEILLPVTIE